MSILDEQLFSGIISDQPLSEECDDRQLQALGNGELNGKGGARVQPSLRDDVSFVTA